MPTLPDRPHLDSLRKQARELQRAARAGEPGAAARLARHGLSEPKLSAAQFVVAREHGFPSWARLVRYLRVVAEHGFRTGLGAEPSADPSDEFCRLACLTYGGGDGPERWARATAPERPHIWAAAAAGRADEVGRLLAGQPALATGGGGPFGWRPLFYLAYSRCAGGDPVAVARLLLDAGADPDEGYLFDGLASPFTVLTGVFGNGEQGASRQPRHPRWRELATLLLERGADPNDGQALYNNMFQPDDAHLELLFRHGLGASAGGPWAERVPTLDSPARVLRVQLRWAVEHHQPNRVRLLAAHGVDVVSPFGDDGPDREDGDGPAWSPRDGSTPVELARLSGDTEIVDILLEHGARPPEPDPAQDLIAAAFRADRAEVARIVAADPDVAARARERRPGLVVWAASRAAAETVSVLVELGFDVNAYGRGDAPVEERWETALHHAAVNGDVALTRHLLGLGADPDLRDHRFDGTPLDWARHFDRAATAAVLEPLTGGRTPRR